MPDIVIPRALNQARVSFRYIDPSGVSRSRYTGIAQVTSNGGDRVAATIDFSPCGGGSSTSQAHRAQLKAFLMRMQGRQNKVWVTDESYTPRGSFPASELFTNVDFSSVTGWTGGGSATIAVADGKLRVTATAAAASIGVYASVTLTDNVPYVLRSILKNGAGFTGLTAGPLLQAFAGTSSSNLSTTRGYLLAMLVPQAAGAANNYPMIIGSSTGMLAGDHMDAEFASMSRCILADGGGNLLLQSDTFNTTWAPGGSASVVADSVNAPDGTATGDIIQETGTGNVEHYVTQNISVGASPTDVTFSVSVISATRGWCALRMIESSGSTASYIFVNLTTGALGTLSTGANWGGARAHVVNQGGGWFRVSLTARKTNAAATVSCLISSATSDGSFTYAGTVSQNAVAVWRGCASLGSVPTRGALTTTAAVAAASQTGSGIFVKGLPVSASGLLLAGDWIEIDGQLKMVTASLDSNAAGLGYLQFSPPLRRAVSDNTPIIVHRPMGRFIFAGDAPGWSNEPGVFSQASIDLEEAFG